MPEQWTSTIDTKLAAACGTLGIPTRLETTFIESTGTRVTRFHLALTSMDKLYQTKRLLTGYASGSLSATEPGHPFLTIQRAFINRAAVLDLQSKGSFFRLAKVSGTQGIWQYLPGTEGLPGPAGHQEIIRTADLKLVAALGTVGLPLLAIDGPAGQRCYTLPRHGPPDYLGAPVDGLALMNEWRANKESIPWENPFAQAARGLHNRERFMDSINRDVELILFIKPRTNWKSAFVRADAQPAAFDQMKRHFDA